MLLKDRYKVLRKLKSGGFGQTYLAEDTHMPSKRLCVVKHLIYKTSDPKSEALIRERFEREAAVLEQLCEATDQVPKIYAFFPEANELYLVEEWIEGESLQNYWEEKSQLSEEEVIRLMLNVLDVLEKLHAHRLIHRDIKPDNIILRKRDGKPVLIDFGAVKESADTVVDLQGQPATRFSIGTPGFTPPEQSAFKPVFASDLYSLGVTAICLLTGKWPQAIYNPVNGELEWRQHAPNVSPQLVSVLTKVTRAHFLERYLRAEEMRDALASALEEKRGGENQIYAPTVIGPPPFPVRQTTQAYGQPSVSINPPVHVHMQTVTEIEPNTGQTHVKKISSFFKETFGRFKFAIVLVLVLLLSIAITITYKLNSSKPDPTSLTALVSPVEVDLAEQAFSILDLIERDSEAPNGPQLKILPDANAVARKGMTSDDVEIRLYAKKIPDRALKAKLLLEKNIASVLVNNRPATVKYTLSGPDLGITLMASMPDLIYVLRGTKTVPLLEIEFRCKDRSDISWAITLVISETDIPKLKQGDIIKITPKKYRPVAPQ